MTQPPHTTEQPKEEVWHRQSAEEVLAQLASTATGLSAQAPVQRLAMVAMLVRLMVIVVLRGRPEVAKDPNNQPNGRLERLAEKGATA